MQAQQAKRLSLYLFIAQAVITAIGYVVYRQLWFAAQQEGTEGAGAVLTIAMFVISGFGSLLGACCIWLCMTQIRESKRVLLWGIPAMLLLYVEWMPLMWWG